MTTTWTGTDKTAFENYLLSESGFSILREQSDIILLEDTSNSWGSDLRSTTTWSQTNRSAPTWSSPVKS